MIGISKLYLGTVEPSDALRYGRRSDHLPSHLLQFSQDKKPVVVWNITRQCNLKCRHCPAHAPVHEFDPNWFTDMKPEVYEIVRRQLLPGLGIIHLSGGGEPFMAENLDQMLDDMVDGKRYITVATNGTVIRLKALERLVGSPSLIRVSLDGTTNEMNQYIRGVKLDRILEFLEVLRQIRARGAHPKFTLQVSYVVTRSNVEQMTECVEISHRYGVHQVCFGNFIVDSRIDEFAQRESLHEHPEEVMPHWQRAHDRGRELGVAVYPMAFNPKDQPEDEWRKQKSDLFEGDRIRICPLPWWAVYVEVDGSVKPCCVYQVPFGDLLQESFDAIWNGPKFRQLRRTVNTPAMPETCRNCFIQERL